MAEIKSSSKMWVLVVALIVLVAGGAYLLVKNSASADVVEMVQGSGYRFEVLSKNKLTIENLNYPKSSTSYRIKEPVGLSSGFALRVRHNGSNQIVSKNIKWIRSSSEGFFSMQANDALVGVYPFTSGFHQISAEVGTGRNVQRITLSFSTTGYSSPTPTGSLVTARPYSPTPIPTGSLVTARPYSPTPLPSPVPSVGGTANDTVSLTPVPGQTGACFIDSSGRTICS